MKTPFRDESGQGMVEYGLIITVVALAVIFAISQMGIGLRGKFEEINAELTPKP